MDPVIQASYARRLKMGSKPKEALRQAAFDCLDHTTHLAHALHALRQLKNAVGELTAADLGERHPKLAEAYLDAEQLLLRVDA